MNEPQRLRQRSGPAQRLLDSASLDQASEASRRRALAVAQATAGTFARTLPRRVRPRSPVKTLATWTLVGAAASAALGLIANQLFSVGNTPGPDGRAAASSLPVLEAPQPARSPDIAPELVAPSPFSSSGAKPNGAIEPWVQSPLAAAPAAGAPPGIVGRSGAPACDEVNTIEAARIALRSGDAPGALAKVSAYDSAFPHGRLNAEALALRIQALSLSGRMTEARALAEQFVRRYPEHPLGERVRGVGD